MTATAPTASCGGRLTKPSRKTKRSVSAEGIITNSAVKQLPYPQGATREGILVWPPVGHLFPHDVPPGGDTIVVDGKSSSYLAGLVSATWYKACTTARGFLERMQRPSAPSTGSSRTRTSWPR